MSSLLPITHTLPEPPSANRYWRHDRGRTHLSASAIAYREAVADAIPTGSLVEGNLVVQLTWFRKAKRGDLDNRIKQVLDALQGLLYKSDSQIVAIHAHRADDPQNPRLEVKCWPLVP